MVSVKISYYLHTCKYLLPIFLYGCSATHEHLHVIHHPVHHDGLSEQQAIVVHKVADEYHMVLQKYPGADISSQTTTSSEGRYYDVLTFITKEGEVKNMYFDISAHLRKVDKK